MNLKKLAFIFFFAASLVARSLFLLDNFDEISNYQGKIQKGDLVFIKQDGKYLKYIFDGEKLVVLNSSDNSFKQIYIGQIQKDNEDDDIKTAFSLE